MPADRSPRLPAPTVQASLRTSLTASRPLGDRVWPHPVRRTAVRVTRAKERPLEERAVLVELDGGSGGRQGSQA